MAQAAGSASEAELEMGLVQALRPVPDFRRQENAGKAIRAYKAAGILPLRPVRSDYTDYYLVTRPTKFLGNELVLVEEEYLIKYIGCCVNQGAGVYVRVVSTTDPLEKFARENMCRFDVYEDAKAVLAEKINFPAKLPAGRYASLRCHANDEEKK
jgi:hypothetical protein